MKLQIKFTPHIEPGTRITIAGVAFGPQYGREGFTTACKPGQETLLIVQDGGVVPFGMTRTEGKKFERNPPPKHHGPPKRSRW